MDFSPSVDTTLKVIEVTARQIVDRISANNASEGAENLSNTSSTDSVENKRTSLKERRSSSIKSNTEMNDGRRSSILNEGNVSGSTGGGITPPVGSPGENSIVQQLLTTVQDWIIDALPQKQGVKGRNSLSLSKGITNDMHWVYSIESYIRTLDISSQNHLGEKFSSQLVLWLKHLFHFKSYPAPEIEYNSVFPHWEPIAGVASLTQFVLHLKFPALANKGYDCFSEEGNYPIIYCSDEYLGRHIRFKLGLPNGCIKIIATMNPDWVKLLEQEILNDTKKKLTPVMLLLNIGKSETDVHNLENGCHLAEKYKLWIHLYGANILAYFCKRPESDQIGHSFTIDLTKWLHSPAVPFLTLYKKLPKLDQTRVEFSGLSGHEILSFSSWFLTQAIGWAKFLALIDELVERGQFVLKMVQKFECLNVVPNWSTLSDGQIIVSALTFQYRPPKNKREDGQSYQEVSGAETEHPSAQYIDTLNSWLFHIMERDLKSYLPVEFVIVEGFGWNILIDLFKTKSLTSVEKETIVNIFDSHMTVLQATVSQKLVFSRLVKAAPELEWVDHEKLWAGLGAVRYIPKFNRPLQEVGIQTSIGNGPSNTVIDPKPTQEMQKTSFDMKENIDHLNAKIVDKLKAIDTAFSLGESSTGDWCVQFGMVTLETDVAELVRLVISSGEEIEASSEFLKRMSELVLEGIEKATLELKRESEEALWEEGILRRVPVVGTFVNWWSPPVKESGVRGRALNLAQGKVESTENIYKYHMQVEAFSASTSATSNNSSNSNSNTTVNATNK